LPIYLYQSYNNVSTFVRAYWFYNEKHSFKIEKKMKNNEVMHKYIYYDNIKGKQRIFKSFSNDFQDWVDNEHTSKIQDMIQSESPFISIILHLNHKHDMNKSKMIEVMNSMEPLLFKHNKLECDDTLLFYIVEKHNKYKDNGEPDILNIHDYDVEYEFYSLDPLILDGKDGRLSHFIFDWTEENPTLT
jgi:hypothetical protein